ncbi:MAG: helix-turn-helix domain-containing protein [Desulfotomaculales bacterium]
MRELLKPTEKLTLTPQEIMAATGIGKNSVYKALQSGELRGKRIGKRKWIVSGEELKRWISEQ